ncbi:MAG TPA: hypothetical protein DEH25_09395 [Chloroflexi bacterium]|nr:hypothetical protein [Chloroflexota bacterium]
MKRYLAYLLRLWPGDESETPVWHASLENPHTREVLAFTSIESLYGYLCTLITAPTNFDQPPSEGDPNPPTQNLPTR